jgi:effector-binding domain-containing protein
MQYIITLQTLPTSQPTAILRRQASLPELPKVVPETCGDVWRLVRAQNIQGAGRNLALYLDEQINMEIGVELGAPLAVSAPLIASALPAGTVAATTHFGPYPQLPHAHQAVRDFCRLHGHTLAGPNWEIYGHWQDSWKTDPSKIRTDVFYLLKD